MKLEIKLNQQYKSFPDGFETTLQGKLIILSGINGSGKSQLLDIIHQMEGNNVNKKITGNITLNGDKISSSDIEYRSFKESINVPDFIIANPQHLSQHKQNVFSNYSSYRLNPNSNPNLSTFQGSCNLAKNILIEKLGEVKFNGGKITQNDVENSIPDDFIRQTDDIFSNTVSDIFTIYASQKRDLESDAGRKGIKADYSELGKAPWTEFNELFNDLKLSYRFRNDYEMKSYQLNEQPKLYQIDSNETIIESAGRLITELSDGEKAILSFAFGSLSGEKKQARKILLLDEFDAPLNPSLTEMYFQILEKYFINEGIQVIMTTHSPSTISMAPEYATFYEVFKSGFEKRILEVDRDDYAEMQVANMRFYNAIENQKERNAELERVIEGKNSIISSLNKQTITLLSEGKNYEYIKKAFEFYGTGLDIEVKEINDLNCDQLEKLFIELNRTQLETGKIFFVRDCDAYKNYNLVKNLSTKKLFPYLLEKNVNNTKIPGGIENMFNDQFLPDPLGDYYQEKKTKRNDGGKTTELNKKLFEQYILNNGSAELFANFKPLFDFIKKTIENDAGN